MTTDSRYKIPRNATALKNMKLYDAAINFELNPLKLLVPNFGRIIAWYDNNAMVEQEPESIDFLTWLKTSPSGIQISNVIIQIILAYGTAHDIIGLILQDISLSDISLKPAKYKYIRYTYDNDIYYVQTFGYTARINPTNASSLRFPLHKDNKIGVIENLILQVLSHTNNAMIRDIYMLMVSVSQTVSFGEIVQSIANFYPKEALFKEHVSTEDVYHEE